MTIKKVALITGQDGSYLVELLFKKGYAETIKKIVGYEGELTFNASNPDGTMVKLADPSKLHELGWRHEIELEDGIERVYRWYLENQK